MTPIQELITTITACLMCIGIVASFIVYLFTIAKEKTKLETKKLKLEIKRLEQTIEWSESKLEEYKRDHFETVE